MQQFKLRTSKCIHAYPEGEYQHTFPIAAIVEMKEDFYEPSGKIGLGRLEKYWALRKESSRSAEQSAILLAMAQAQARILDLSRFGPKLHRDSRLQTLQVGRQRLILSLLANLSNDSLLSLWLIDIMFK